MSERKWAGRKYHVQDNDDVSHKDVKMYCDTNQFPELPFCGPHPKPNVARGLSKHYHLRFDPKLGHVICEIFRILCACVGCTSILENPGFLVYHHRNRHATNLSPIVIIGQFWDHIKLEYN